MIDYIKGLLSRVKPDKIVLEVSGIGYGIFITASTAASLPSIGSEVILYTSTIIREDSQNTYGFLQEVERDFFELLNQISGIGPRLALAILGHFSLSQLQDAVHHSNTAALCQIPGIGKKMGEKLLIELRDKFVKFSKQDPAFTLPQLSIDGKQGDSSELTISSDAIKALIHLGYQPLQAQHAVKTASAHAKKGSLSELISLALKVKN